MPLFIPIVIGLIGAATAVKGGTNIATNRKRKNELEKKFSASKSKLSRKQNSLAKRAQEIDKRVKYYGKRKADVARETFKTATEFLKKVKTKKLNIETKYFHKVDEMEQALKQMKKFNLAFGTVIEGTGKSTIAGAAAAGGVYSMVGYLGAASTGTALSTLNGAVATKATYAAIGGGAKAAGGLGIAGGMGVLTIAAAGPALLVASWVHETEIDKMERAFEKHMNKIDEACGELILQHEELKAFDKNLSIVRKGLNECNSILRKTIRTASPDDMNDVMRVYELCRAVMQILEIPLMTPEGKINTKEIVLHNPHSPTKKGKAA